MINFQRPVFPDMNNVINIILYTKLFSQFRTVHNLTALETQEQANKTA